MKICINCSKPINNPKFCSNKCQSEFKYKEFIEDWKSGKTIDKKSNHIKHFLLEKYGYKCCGCGWSEINPFTKTLPLEVEHIDGNSENNLEDNLKLLCPNCHSLTKTYKGANKGNGRHFRRQRYKDNKSY